jgi:cystathionine beta-lyase
VFDELIKLKGRNNYKWDGMPIHHGISAENGISMSVAEMDFRPPECIQSALQDRLNHGFFGYDLNTDHFIEALVWWMRTRHDCDIPHEWLIPTSNTMNAIAICIETYTRPGDGIVIFSPVYHQFSNLINKTGRKVVECPLQLHDSRYQIDFDACEDMLDGTESMILFCSPHNPGGRVWTRSELSNLAALAKQRDLLVVSDEIHQDIVYAGHSHTPALSLSAELNERLITISSPGKTFNLAGLCIGCAIIPSLTLREQFRSRFETTFIAPNSLGLSMAAGAYSPEGADWVDELVAYMTVNKEIFHQAIDESGSATAMPIEATYLSWVSINDNQKDAESLIQKIEQDARIAVCEGSTFGSSSKNFVRINLATQRTQVIEAANRLKAILSRP